jgi:hypothetical protein
MKSPPILLKSTPRRPSENALLPKLFVILEKIILGISTICLWLFFQAFLDFEQNSDFSRVKPTPQNRGDFSTTFRTHTDF